MSCGLSFLGGFIAGDEANALEDCGGGRRNGALRRCEDTKRSWTVGRVDEKRKWAMSLFVSLSGMVVVELYELRGASIVNIHLAYQSRVVAGRYK